MEAKKLFEILKGDQLININGHFSGNVNTLCIDSRKAKTDDCYIAVKGSTVDGHDFIDSAISNGAKFIVCETMPKALNPDVQYVLVKDGRTAIAQLAHCYYDFPSRKMKVVGVTGTNGKTTVATLLHQFFTQLGKKCGLLSTVENRIGDVVKPSTHTTPDAISIAQLMAEMYDESCEFIFMEVSSHALDQKRTSGIDFNVAIFTNITHDHLDYHGNFLHYINAKKSLFDHLPSDAYAVINVDDKNGRVMIQNSKAKVKTYGMHTMADFHTRLMSDDLTGLHLKINQYETIFSMVGAFNAYNLTAAFATAQLMGMEAVESLSVLSTLSGAEGRMEKVIDNTTGKIGIVDYAHTPDALENVLKTINKSLKSGQKIITLIGCGGDRDKTKRPLMANIASKLSNKVILTSDNPRSEDPEAILQDMKNGLDEDQLKNCLTMVDRLMAIKTAVMIASNGDVILVAGKGHEKYQEIKGEKFPFEDKKILSDALSGNI